MKKSTKKNIQILKEKQKVNYEIKNKNLFKVVVIINPNKFQILKETLNKIEIKGLTLTHVNGCGMQKGNINYY